MMTIDEWPAFETAYAMSCFDHGKRHTYPLILDVARQMGDGLRVVDIGCGPAVIDGILLTALGARIERIDLLDSSEGFLGLARRHLAEWKEAVGTHRFEFNDPGTWPKLAEADLVISCNALFHVEPAGLRGLYRWCHELLRPQGVLVNHQTFAWGNLSAGEDLARLAPCLAANAGLDVIDAEIGRRARLDKEEDPCLLSAVDARPYGGLHLTVTDHLTALGECGFAAEEVWRHGASAAILAQRG